MFTRAQKKRFYDNGYIAVDLQIDHALLDQITRDVELDYIHRYHADPRYAHSVRVQDGWKRHESVRQLAALPAVLLALQELFGRRPLPFQTLNFSVGTEQRLHSDTIHFNSMPGGYLAGVWVALEDVDEQNGPLIYYPGSHQWPEYTMEDCGLDKGLEHYTGYEDFIEDEIRKSSYRPECGILSKGQALIWHGNLVHGGAGREDRARTRHSQATHYFFEGCSYYTPVNSTLENIEYRSPEWIPIRPHEASVLR